MLLQLHPSKPKLITKLLPLHNSIKDRSLRQYSGSVRYSAWTWLANWQKTWQTTRLTRGSAKFPTKCTSLDNSQTLFSLIFNSGSSSVLWNHSPKKDIKNIFLSFYTSLSETFLSPFCPIIQILSIFFNGPSFPQNAPDVFSIWNVFFIPFSIFLVIPPNIFHDNTESSKTTTIYKRLDVLKYPRFCWKLTSSWWTHGYIQNY